MLTALTSYGREYASGLHISKRKREVLLMFDLWIALINGAIQLSLAAWAIHLTIKSLPHGQRKASHLWLLISLTALALIFLTWNSINAAQGQSKLDDTQAKLLGLQRTSAADIKQARDDAQASRLKQENMSGQLTVIQGTLTEIIKNDQGNNSRALSALASVAQTISTANREPSREAANPTNKNLLDRATTAAAKMRNLAQRYETEERQLSDAHMRAGSATRNPDELKAYFKSSEAKEEEQQFESAMHKCTADAETQYLNDIFGEASYLWNEILKRLPPRPRGHYDYMFENGNNFGAFPLLPAANDLESLARQLPSDAKKK